MSYYINLAAAFVLWVGLGAVLYGVTVGDAGLLHVVVVGVTALLPLPGLSCPADRCKQGRAG